MSAYCCMYSRYTRTAVVTTWSRSRRAKPCSLATTWRLAARRLTSHSHGPGSVSSKSFTSKITLRSGVAKVPKLATCASPHACTVRPVTGVTRQVGGHHRRRTAVERERRRGHTLVAHRHQLLDARQRLLFEDVDGIGAAVRRAPVRVGRAGHLGAEGAPGVPALVAGARCAHLADPTLHRCGEEVGSSCSSRCSARAGAGGRARRRRTAVAARDELGAPAILLGQRGVRRRSGAGRERVQRVQRAVHGEWFTPADRSRRRDDQGRLCRCRPRLRGPSGARWCRSASAARHSRCATAPVGRLLVVPGLDRQVRAARWVERHQLLHRERGPVARAGERAHARVRRRTGVRQRWLQHVRRRLSGAGRRPHPHRSARRHAPGLRRLGAERPGDPVPGRAPARRRGTASPGAPSRSTAPAAPSPPPSSAPPA